MIFSHSYRVRERGQDCSLWVNLGDFWSCLQCQIWSCQTPFNDVYSGTAIWIFQRSIILLFRNSWKGAIKQFLHYKMLSVSRQGKRSMKLLFSNRFRRVLEEQLSLPLSRVLEEQLSLPLSNGNPWYFVSTFELCTLEIHELITKNMIFGRKCRNSVLQSDTFCPSCSLH